MFGIRVRQEYDQFQAFYDEAAGILAWPKARLFGVVPEVSGWSAAQHLHHVAVMNERILTWLMQCCENQAETSSEGRPNALGLALLAMGRLPRGRGEAPRSFRPPATLTPADLGEALTRSRALLTALEPYLPGLPHLKARQHHAVFGKLSSPQFLRFARIHALHHLAIIHDIDRRRDADASDPASRSQPAS